MVDHADIDHSAVTGAGIPATIVDVKGDIIAATAANTVARLAAGANGTVLTAASGETTGLQWATPSAGGIPTGTSMPGGPSTNDLIFRTDLGIVFYWDGTRWVSLELYRAEFGVGASLTSTTTSPQTLARWTPWHTTFDLWGVAFYRSTFVATTNDGTKFWTIDFQKIAADDTATSIVAPTTAADTASNWSTSTTAVGALLAPTTNKHFRVQATKTSTPGALYWACGFTYRLVGT